MEHRISLLFYCRKSKKGANGLTPIYMRITINGRRLELSTHRQINPSDWSTKLGRVKGRAKLAKEINLYMETLATKAHRIEREMVQNDQHVTFAAFKEKWLGRDTSKRMLLEVFQEHNHQIAALIKTGKSYSSGTLDRYNTSKEHVSTFLQWKYGLADIDIRRLNYEFVSDFAFWLKAERACSHNTSMKYISNLKKIVLSCVHKGWLSKDPFLCFKISLKEVEKDALTMHELELIIAKNFTINRLKIVKDIFLFSCFTGLAYADVKNLNLANIQIGIDGNYWIALNRQKTSAKARIPLLPQAQTIIEKYSDYSAHHAGLALPILSNQKMNAYLKEIGDLCGIQRDLTFHLARHTFATTITLNHGVPIESVSKMLGHRNLQTTQHYAKVQDRKVGEDMRKLKKKLKPK